MMKLGKRKRSFFTSLTCACVIMSAFTATDIVANQASSSSTLAMEKPVSRLENPNPLQQFEEEIALSSCHRDQVIPFNEERHKKRFYRVGVLAIRGFEAAYNEFNSTFMDYLTATAGQRFDPPLQFELVPLNFKLLFTDTEAGNVDFIYVNPSAFSCIESEFTAKSLVSQVSQRKINGNIYNLKRFGGVIMARADNDEVNHIQDLRDKVIAAASISGLGSGQMQFLEMQKAGMSYINDPKQLVFTSNQGKVVHGVLGGKFDVGFVRTDQIERTKDSNGTLLDPNLFKIIDPQPDLNIGGEPFPFEASTPLYPEWNLAALGHVPDDISEVVQSAMLALADHASVAEKLADCMTKHNNTGYCHFDAFHKVRCDTTEEVAEIALEAKSNGRYSEWTPTLSYMQLRSMQEVTGFINMDPTDNIFKCTRPSTLYNSITCPDGYYKAPEEVVNGACGEEGVQCEEGFQCICSPCVLITECSNGVEIGDSCVGYTLFLPAILIPFFALLSIIVYFYVEYKRKQADAIWAVKPEELKFVEPENIVGKGTFGYVLLAEYRGTLVAVKRVIPPKYSGKNAPKSKKSKKRVAGEEITEVAMTASDHEKDNDIESQDDSKLESICLDSMGPNQLTASLQGSIARKNPGLRSMASRLSTLTGSLSGTSKSGKKPTHSQLKSDFIHEMRHLSKLRHPCITTVMGAVVAKDSEPMLVMEYMTKGSLHDVLKDHSIVLDIEEHIIPILQDVALGMRFLHQASPQVIHGDLKAKNVLIDANFRAKVTDFGLSAKKKHCSSGTPYWMAPELLRGESTNTAQSDIFAFGILMYEVYSRKNPYEGEHYVDVLRKVCDPFVNKRPPIPETCSFKMAELMTECLDSNPSQRPTAEKVDIAVRVEGSVKERTNKLEQLNKDLEEANRKIADASSMQLEHFACMSHEIRTPLNCIVGLSSLMEEMEMSATQSESIGMIASSSRLLQSIVDDVLDFSKLQSGNAEVDIKITDIQKVVADLVKSMRASVIAKKRNVTVRACFKPQTSQYVETDGRRLLQVLFNLVSNAVKFSKVDGVVEVGVDICDRTVAIGGKEEDNGDEMDASKNSLVKFAFKVIRFTVKDYGKGIAKENFENIFQPFTQTNSGVNNIDGGTGLGLAITEKLIKALGGDIKVDSVLGEWTEFTVDLPYELPPARVLEISSRFSMADVVTVGENEHMLEVLRYFQVESQFAESMEEVEKTIKELPKVSGAERRAIVLLVQAPFFNEEVARRVTISHGVKVVVIGPMTGDVEGVANFSHLGEVVPSTFMHSLADMASESLSVRQRRKASIQMCSASSLEHERAPVDLTTLRVLCAEDNNVNQKILIRMLKRVGIGKVEMVENGQLCVDKEKEEPYDIILMDMQMPVMDGIDATKLILAREGGHPLPLVVFVTAHVSAAFETECLECGATAYLPKPYTLPVLKATLEDAARKLQA